MVHIFLSACEWEYVRENMTFMFLFLSLIVNGYADVVGLQGNRELCEQISIIGLACEY